MQSLSNQVQSLHLSDDPPTQRTPTGLCDLPPELIGEIVSYFLEDDLALRYLKKIRRVCKYLNASTYYHFGQVGFPTLSTDLSSKSLRKFEQISKHPYLAPHVRHLRVTTCDYLYYGDELEWRRNKSGWIVSSASVQRWQVVIKRFVNCRAFRVDQRSAYWADYSIRRAAPAPAGGWSLGWKFPIGDARQQGRLELPDAYMVLMRIIAGAEMPVEELDVDFMVEPVPRALDATHVEDPAFRAAWAPLRKLRYVCETDKAPDAEYPLSLLRIAPDLQDLTLGFSSWGGNPDLATPLIRGLASDESLPPFQLKRLDITRGHLGSGESLACLIKRHRRTLQSLRMYSVDVEKGGLRYLMETFRDRNFHELQEFNLHDLGECAAGDPYARDRRYLRLPRAREGTDIKIGKPWKGLLFSHSKLHNQIQGSGPRVDRLLKMVCDYWEILK
ncbi:uncharacterized protein DSM5745_09488 [Aspergillus mulundensis]|uniref:F-box domain-containing protein n=1 Tax=Aspergillus mulundensis TaxID=1810919 RepID=A0A3D8QVF8_9EURO|nr:hypothetical protein DSM5745_09488 [Aspergillus mulundensis]RDW65749.1 hypothetical protein DSM5745_09488 [Aspergillus mulundensis]